MPTTTTTATPMAYMKGTYHLHHTNRRQSRRAECDDLIIKNRPTRGTGVPELVSTSFPPRRSSVALVLATISPTTTTTTKTILTILTPGTTAMTIGDRTLFTITRIAVLTGTTSKGHDSDSAAAPRNPFARTFASANFHPEVDPYVLLFLIW